MDSTSEEKTIERSGPVLRDEYDGVKFRTLHPASPPIPCFVADDLALKGRD